MAKKVALNGIDANNQRIISVADPSGAQDAATKAYVDAVARGLDWKNSVRAASTGNLTLSGTQTVDGVALVAGNEVLVKDQTTGSQNGIYVVASGAWTRRADADSSAEVTSGMAVGVTEGTTNGDKVFVLTTNDPITLDTTALTFTPLGGITLTAGNGITVSGGTTIAVNAGAGLTFSGGALVPDSTIPRKIALNVGDGSSTSVAIVHSLGTKDVIFSFRNVTGDDYFGTDTVSTSTTTLTATFPTAPATNSVRAVVMG